MEPSERTEDGIWRSPVAEVVMPALEMVGVAAEGMAEVAAEASMALGKWFQAPSDDVPRTGVVSVQVGGSGMIGLVGVKVRSRAKR